MDNFIYDLENSIEDNFVYLKQLIKEIANQNLLKEEATIIMSKIYLILFSWVRMNTGMENEEDINKFYVLFKLIGKYINSINSYMTHVFDEKDIAYAEFIDLKKVGYYNENSPVMKNSDDIDGKNQIQKFLENVENEKFNDFLIN